MPSLPLLSHAVFPLRSIVTCSACSEVTEISTVLPNSLLSTYKRASALRAEIVTCNACEKNEKEETAEFWCVVCTEALCDACYVRHKKFSNGHCTFELEHARTLQLSQLTRTVQCILHNQSREAHCYTCCMLKCNECLKGCTADSHDVHLPSDEKYQQYMSSVRNRVRSTAERLGALLSLTLQKSQTIASRLRADRTDGHRRLVKHRRLLYDSISRAFDASVDEANSRQQRTQFERSKVWEKFVARSCAANIEVCARSGVPSLPLLGMRSYLQLVAACCFSSGRASARRLWVNSYDESGSMRIHGSVSLTSDIVPSTRLAMTDRWRAAPSEPLLFSKDSVSFETPVTCHDLAATRDGHVLLAAGEDGLLMYNNREQQLSRWTPTRTRNQKDDWVYCVAELSDRRAAVGVVWAQLVVLLKLSQTDYNWLENRRVAVGLSPGRLAVHGDLLAAVDLRRDKQQQQQQLVFGKLLRLSSARVLYALSRDYDVHLVALTALCVITTSADRVKCSSGTRRYVLDAFTHSGQFLWRCETGDKELVAGICVSADTWRRVYVSFRMEDWSSCRVMAIGGADGKNSIEVLSNQTHRLQLPSFLSLARGQQRTVLATWSDMTDTVWLYESTG